MSFHQRFDDYLKTVLKMSDKQKVSVVRMVKTALKNKQIEKGADLSDDEILSVITKLSNQGRESIEQFSNGGREDLADKERQELTILQSYLPKQLTPEEIDMVINEVIIESSPEGIKDIGNVMRLVMPRVRGAVDGKIIQQRVRDLLTMQ